MTNDCLTQKLAFNLSKLIPGRAVQLIEPVHMPGESPRKKTAIVKDISPFTITLLFVRLSGHSEDDNTRTLRGEVEEKEYPVEAFEGVGCYELERFHSEEKL
jgi:hypothetical protein